MFKLIFKEKNDFIKINEWFYKIIGGILLILLTELNSKYSIKWPINGYYIL